MQRRRVRGVPVTIDYFSKNTLVIRSLHDRSLLVVLPAVAGVFSFMIGGISILGDVLVSSLSAITYMLSGAILLLIAYRLHRNAWEIYIDSSRGTILGLRETRGAVPFHDIDGIELSPNEFGDGWTLTLTIRHGKPAVLLYDYPPDLALHIGEHLSRILARPLHCPSSLSSLRLPQHVIGSFPYKMPDSRFPFIWIILSGTVAALIPVALTFFPLGPFHAIVLPRWFILAAIAIPGIIWVSDTHQEIGQVSAGVASSVVLFLLLAAAVIALNCPAGASMWLFPGISAALLTADAAVRKHRIKIWLLVTAVCLCSGLYIAGWITYQYYSFKHLDPSVLTSVTIDTSSGHRVILDKPRDIHRFISGFQSAHFYQSALQPRRPLCTAVLHRPFGIEFMLHIKTEGRGWFRQTVFMLSGDLFSHRFRIATLVTSNTRERFRDIKPLAKALQLREPFPVYGGADESR